MLDSHCHLDMYPNPLAVAADATGHGVFILAVTNLPSHFAKGLPHVRGLKRVRLALGLHPLTAEQHAQEMALFEKYLPQTSFVGEVGLDFSPQGVRTKQRQIQTFRRVVELVSESPKVVSLHSRRAEREVLDILKEYGVRGAVFHWYTGPVALLRQAVDEGHYFSINPSMTTSASGQRVIAALPVDRVLTESDGPYAKVNGVPAKPVDVMSVEKYLGSCWAKDMIEVRSLIWNNFKKLTRIVGGG